MLARKEVAVQEPSGASMTWYEWFLAPLSGLRRCGVVCAAKTPLTCSIPQTAAPAEPGSPRGTWDDNSPTQLKAGGHEYM
jgi:hypothetical protein